MRLEVGWAHFGTILDSTFAIKVGNGNAKQHGIHPRHG